MINMKYKLIKRISIYLCFVIILLNVLSCIKIEKDNLADNNDSNTVSTSSTNESGTSAMTKEESENIVATSNDASKAKNKSV